MAGGAQLSVPDMRRAARHPVDYPVIGEHRGFMVDGVGEETPAFGRGDRVIIRLPLIGRIEAYCIWVTEDRAGFQFERIIRLDDFMAMIEELQPNPRLRRRG